MMVSPQDIGNGRQGPLRTASNTQGVSTSPTSAFHSPPPSWGPTSLTRTATGAFPKQLKPFATKDIKILLLENINQTGREKLSQEGYQVEVLKTSLGENELIEKIRGGVSSLSIDGSTSG